MADKKFGLPDSLINAVKQVAENNAPLPRDERERDLARQARSNPKSLDEAKKGFIDTVTDDMTGKDAALGLAAKGIVGAARLIGKGLKKIVGKEEFVMEESEHPAVVAFASKAHEEWRKGFDPEGSGKERIKKNSDGTEGNINVPFNKLHPDWQKENLAAGRAALEAVKKHGSNTEAAAEHIHNEWMKRNPKADYNAAQHVPYKDLPEDEKEKDRVHVRTMRNLLTQKEETQLHEAPMSKAERLKRQKRREAMRGTKTAPKPKKTATHKEPDNEKKEPKKVQRAENETPNDNPNENIITQLRKLPFEGKHRITFKNGKTHLLSPAIVNKARTLHTNMHPSKKGDFQERLAASLESFQDVVENPENEAPKPKGKEALLAPKPLDKNFMANLDRLSKAYKEKQAAKGK